MATPFSPASAVGEVASFYNLHLALVDGVAYAWQDRAEPRAILEGVIKVAAAKTRAYALTLSGRLLTWRGDLPDQPAIDDSPLTLFEPVLQIAAGHTGWFAIDPQARLWRGPGEPDGGPPLAIASDVSAACIGDGADYFIDRSGDLYVTGLAHRGQYGDGLLTASAGYVRTAREAVDVRAHTGHALHLRRDGKVMGTGGNRFGPLSSHGLGDKADRWGTIFEGAAAIATGSRHSLAIRADGSLWAWGEGFQIAPGKILDGVRAAAAGDTATIALSHDGSLWQWDGGVGPRRLRI